MEMIMENGFEEMTIEEIMMTDGGAAWYEHVGNLGFVGCTLGAIALGATPLGLAAGAAAALWGFHGDL